MIINVLYCLTRLVQISFILFSMDFAKSTTLLQGNKLNCSTDVIMTISLQ